MKKAMEEVTKMGLQLQKMRSVDNILRYPCPLCVSPLIEKYKETFSWYDLISGFEPSTKNLTQYVVKQPRQKVIPPIVSFSFKAWLSKGEILAKMGSNKTGTLQHLKAKAPTGYFVCEDPFER